MTDESKLWAPTEAWPRYPIMTVTGIAVSRDLAREIIRRIDVTFQGSGPPTDDEYWKDEFHRRLKMPRCPDYVGDMRGKLAIQEDIFRVQERFEEWRRDWGVIPLDAIYTDWISSPGGEGPSGWVHPGGRIGFQDHVSEKNPTPEGLLAEWRLVAAAFPALSLSVSFGTSGAAHAVDPIPLMQLRVRDGGVTVVPRDQALDTVGHDRILPSGPWRPSDPEMLRDPRWSRGCPESWIDEWERKAQEIAWAKGRTT